MQLEEILDTLDGPLGIVSLCVLLNEPLDLDILPIPELMPSEESFLNHKTQIKIDADIENRIVSQLVMVSSIFKARTSPKMLRGLLEDSSARMLVIIDRIRPQDEEMIERIRDCIFVTEDIKWS